MKSIVSRTPRTATLLVLVCWTLPLIAMLLSAPLWPIDETRYMGVAWEMMQSQHWLVPQIAGAPYPDKPPLLFWWLIGGWHLFGTSVAWARIGMALFALATLGLTAHLARRLWPERATLTRQAPLILAGSALWLALTPLVMFDILLSFCVIVGITGVALAGFGERPRTGWALVAVGIGFGILAKGPVALLHILPVAVLAPLWREPSGRHGRWYGGLLLALLGGAAIALAWALSAAFAGGTDYAHAIFWGQSAGRMVDSFAHGRPVWWYLPLLPILVFPWLLWPSAWQGLWHSVRQRDPGIRFTLCWLLPPFISFSLISGKQVHYLLPLFPAIALLLARGLEPDGAWRRWRWDGLPIALALFALAAITWLGPDLAAARKLPEWVQRIPPWTPLLLIAVAMLAVWPAHSTERHLRRLTLVGSGLIVVFLLGVLRLAAPWYDLRQPAAIIATAQADGRPVAHDGGTDDRFHFLGRLHHPLTVIDGDETVQWSRMHPDGLIVRYYEHRNDIPTGASPVYQQPFRSDWLVIWSAEQIAHRNPN